MSVSIYFFVISKAYVRVCRLVIGRKEGRREWGRDGCTRKTMGMEGKNELRTGMGKGTGKEGRNGSMKGIED